MFEFIRDLWNGGTRPRSAVRNPQREREQQMVAEIRDRYRRELINNNGEVDRDEAESLVKQIYEFAGLTPPPEFIWVDHPEEGVIAATLMERDWGNITGQHDKFLIGKLCMLGTTFRNAMVANKGSHPDQETWGLARELLPSLEDAASVFRHRLGGKGMLMIRKDAPYALDSWLDAFLILEEEFRIQSPAFAKRWESAAAGIWVLNESEHREELQVLLNIGHAMLGENNWWEREEPHMLSGSMEAYYAAIAELNLSALQHQDDREIRIKGLHLLQQYIRHCGWCFPFRDFCIMADRPEQLFDLKDIDDEENIEARRLMIELYGFGKYLADVNARLVAKDEYGMLYRIPQRDDEDLVLVKVINSTPEPDGTFREYFLRVPPDTPTARSGVAWSFGMREDDYAPALET